MVSTARLGGTCWRWGITRCPPRRGAPETHGAPSTHLAHAEIQSRNIILCGFAFTLSFQWPLCEAWAAPF